MDGGLTLLRVSTALHSVVGLAAVLTSIGSVLADVGHASTLHVRISSIFIIGYPFISVLSSLLPPISVSSLVE